MAGSELSQPYISPELSNTKSDTDNDDDNDVSFRVLVHFVSKLGIKTYKENTVRDEANLIASQ